MNTIELPGTYHLRVAKAAPRRRAYKVAASHGHASIRRVLAAPRASWETGRKIRTVSAGASFEQRADVEAIEIDPGDDWESPHDFRRFEAEVSTAAIFLSEFSALVNLVCSAEAGSHIPAASANELLHRTENGVLRIKPNLLKRLSQGDSIFRGFNRLSVDELVGLSFEVVSVSFSSPFECDLRLKLKGKLKKTVVVTAISAVMGLFAGLAPVGNTTFKPNPAGPQQELYEQWRSLYRTQIGTGGVKEVQAILRELGFDPGPIDGHFGPKTRIAIDKFAVKHQLPVGLKWNDNDLDDALAREMAQKGFQLGK